MIEFAAEPFDVLVHHAHLLLELVYLLFQAFSGFRTLPPAFDLQWSWRLRRWFLVASFANLNPDAARDVRDNSSARAPFAGFPGLNLRLAPLIELEFQVLHWLHHNAPRRRSHASTEGCGRHPEQAGRVVACFGGKHVDLVFGGFPELLPLFHGNSRFTFSALRYGHPHVIGKLRIRYPGIASRLHGPGGRSARLRRLTCRARRADTFSKLREPFLKRLLHA